MTRLEDLEERLEAQSRLISELIMCHVGKYYNFQPRATKRLYDKFYSKCCADEVKP